MLTSARPKIANYHFTTLTPNLGVVQRYDHSFVLADIPGLIEGAAEGAGLGHDFLRHVERTRMLIHVLDISGCEGRDPLEDYRQINQELARYSQRLAELPHWWLPTRWILQGQKKTWNGCVKHCRTRPFPSICGYGPRLWPPAGRGDKNPCGSSQNVGVPGGGYGGGPPI